VLVFGSSITALGVVRALGRAKILAYSVGPTPHLLGSSRWYRQFDLGSCPDPEPGRLRTFLDTVQLERAMLMPCADDWARAVAYLDAGSRQRFLTSISAGPVIDTFLDKWEFAQMLMRERLPHPRTSLLESLEQMSALPEACYANGFLKPLASLEFGARHKVKAFLIKNKTDALETMTRAQSSGCNEFPIMLQEYIPGPPTNHYFIDGFVDRRGTIRALFARQRIRMHPPLLGNSTLMVSVGLDRVAGAVDTLRRMWAALDYRGIFSAEFKYDDRDGLFKILEVNARPWWFIEFAAQSGVDVCSMAYRDALGLPVSDVTSYPVGRRCVYLTKDYKAYCLEGARGGFFRWVRSWLGADGTVFCWDDPGPALAYFAEVAKFQFRSRVRK